MSFISYSQNFEDFILWRALKHVKNGFYIDVGAYDPIEDSVTKYFYDNGWFGINIDPVISYQEKFLLERPRDINLNILISDTEGEVDFYENNETGISSAIEDNAKSWQKESNFEFKKLKKIAKTLDTVCAENKIDTVHFLKIDVEGFEINVLRGFSFNAVRPWIVLFESVAPTGKHEDISSDCVAYLKSKQYHQVYFDGLNKFFVSDEHKELDATFSSPLNIFDQPNIELNNSHWLVNNKISGLEQIYQQVKTELNSTKIQLDSTETELNSTKSQLDTTNTELNSTKIQLDSTETELNSTKSQLDTTNTELNSTKSQLDTTNTELNSTKSQLESKDNELNRIYSSRSWRVIVLMQNIINVLIPRGSKRRKIVKLFLKPLKIIYHIKNIKLQFNTIFLEKYLKPTSTSVATAYYCFLGREPEAEIVVLEHIKQKTVGRLIIHLISSEEFKNKVNKSIIFKFKIIHILKGFLCYFPVLFFFSIKNSLTNYSSVALSELTPRARQIYINLMSVIKKGKVLDNVSVTTCPQCCLSKNSNFIELKDKRSLRIVIDMQGAQSPSSKTRGVGRYTIEMVKAFLDIAYSKHEIFLVLNGTFEDEAEAIRSEFSHLLPKENIKCWQQYLVPVSGVSGSGISSFGVSGNLWNRKVTEILREWYISQLAPDIVWSTNLQEGWHDDAVTSVGVFLKDTFYCSNLHDVIPLIYPKTHLDKYNESWYLEKIDFVRKSDVILTDSKYSKEKIVELLGVENKKIYITPCAINKYIFNNKESLSINQYTNCLVESDFILYVGGADIHKNLLKLILAYSLLSEEIKSKYKLVIAGKEPKDREVEFIKYGLGLGITPDRLVFTGYISDVELACLYRKASLFVFPSYSEGFGIPPLEAMACGCPVIAANAASLPEIVGLSEALFDPYDENDIALKISSGLLNEDYRKKLISNGIIRSEMFSWESSAKIILNIFESKIVNQLEHTRMTDSVFSNYQDLIMKRLIECIVAVPKVENGGFSPLAQAISDNIISKNGQSKVYLDISCLVHFDHATGIQRVARAIIVELKKIHFPGVEFIVIFSYVGHKYFYRAEICGDRYFPPNVDNLKSNIIDFSDGDIILFLDLHPSNIISKKNEIARLRNRGIKIYSILYDLLPIAYPSYFVKQFSEEFKEWLHSVVHLDGALCISKDVAGKLKEWIDTNQIIPDKFFEIKYFHLGADLENSSPSIGLPNDAGQLLAKFSKTTSFLMVGTVEPRKGHAFTLDAFEILWKSRINTTLIIVGHQGWCNEVTANRIRTHKEYNKRLFWLEGISDEYLEKIYSVSTCLIAASEGEGFGLPLIEAAQHKLPIIARDIPVFREVAGEHAFYFNGFKPHNLSDAINKWLALNVKSEAPQSTNMPWLTWKQSTQQLLKLILPEINYSDSEKINQINIINNYDNREKNFIKSRRQSYFRKLINMCIIRVAGSRFRKPLKKIYYTLRLNRLK